MDPVEDYIEGFLQHGFLDKEARKRYNREYYLKTRKLKGMLGNPFNNDKKKKAPGATRKAAAERADRLALAKKKVERAREAAKKAPPSKRKVLEEKLDSLQKKLAKADKKVFGNAVEPDSMGSRAVAKAKADWDKSYKGKKPTPQSVALKVLNEGGNQGNQLYSRVFALDEKLERKQDKLENKIIKKVHKPKYSIENENPKKNDGYSLDIPYLKKNNRFFPDGGRYISPDEALVIKNNKARKPGTPKEKYIETQGRPLFSKHKGLPLKERLDIERDYFEAQIKAGWELSAREKRQYKLNKERRAALKKAEKAKKVKR